MGVDNPARAVIVRLRVPVGLAIASHDSLLLLALWQMELSLSLLDRTSSTDKPKIEALNATLDVLKSTIREVRFRMMHPFNPWLLGVYLLRLKQASKRASKGVVFDFAQTTV